MPNDSTVKLLTQYIVASTGQQPLVFAGNLNKSTQGTGGAGGTSLRPGAADTAAAPGAARGGCRPSPAGAPAGTGAPAAAAPAPHTGAAPTPPAAAMARGDR